MNRRSITCGRVRLNAGRFTLAPLEMADAAEVLCQFADPSVVAFMDIEPMTSVAEAQAIIAWAQAQRADGVGLRLSIRDRGDYVGTCGFERIDGAVGEIAYDLVPGRRGERIMAAVLPTLLAFGWRELALERIEAKVAEGNAASCAVLERLGFTRLGPLTGQGPWKGRYWTQHLYALTRPSVDATL
ncbi:MAG TPA: GNAT family protein [Caulobacteraceae bacterium]